MRCRVRHVGEDAKVLQSSSCTPSDHAKLPHSHRGLRCSFLGLSNSFCRKLSRQFQKNKLLCIISYLALCSSHLRTAVMLILTAPCVHRTMPLRGGPCVHLLSWLLVHLSLRSVFPMRRKGIRTVELYVFLVTPLFATAVPPPT